jgi:hypothetical protein
MGGHPYFTSPVEWHVRLDEALAEAKASGKRVFLQFGRLTCSGTRALVERTLAKDEVAEYLAQHFVALASDADHAEPRVAELVAGLPRTGPTPVCAYLDAEGRVLHSTAGGRPPAVLLNDMLTAVSKRL